MAVINHPAMQQPADASTPVWRYMDFTKLVATLETSSLFFARADCLGDPFEGSFSRLSQQLRPLAKQQRFKGAPSEMLQQMEDAEQRHNHWQRKWTFVSCWHMNLGESAAMWQLYAKSNEAVAIKSTYHQLAEQLDNKTCIGIVKYIDFERDLMPEGNMMSPYFHKRRSFAHELEARAIFIDLPTKDHEPDFDAVPPASGVSKPVSLQALVNEVYVAPTSPKWFKVLVEQVSRRYGLNKPVHQSSLDAEPFF